MMSNDNSNNRSDTRIDWIEPEIVELNVTETAKRPRFGRDAGPNPDCSRS